MVHALFQKQQTLFVKKLINLENALFVSKGIYQLKENVLSKIPCVNLSIKIPEVALAAGQVTVSNKTIANKTQLLQLRAMIHSV